MSLVLLQISNPSFAIASPWPMPEGQGQTITRTENFTARTFRQLTTSIYSEYGLTDRTTFIGKLAYATQEYGGQFPSTTQGLTAADISVQHLITRTDHSVFAGRITYAAETEMDRLLQAENTRFEPIRYGNAIEIAFLAGHSIHQDGSFFVTAETGFRYALADDADLINLSLTTGFKPSERWLLLAKSLNTVSLQNDSNGIDYDVFRLEPSLVFHRNDRTSYALGASYDLYGRNLQTGSSLYLSFWNRF
ncbi:MAG: hypothetical protein MRY72_13455 [Aquisalinus sp.]|nr:hypothetical protein [Aquisalinus sp.]